MPRDLVEFVIAVEDIVHTRYLKKNESRETITITTNYLEDEGEDTEHEVETDKGIFVDCTIDITDEKRQNKLVPGKKYLMTLTELAQEYYGQVSKGK